MSVILLILGLVLFIGLVVVHEYGHFIMARRGGVDVEEFGIGFPPRAKVLTKRNGTTYTLNWLPLGGFVRLKGEHDADKSPGSYGAASVSTKIKIMLAGVVMNLLTAFVMLTFLALIGMPKLIENQFTVARDTRIIRQQVLVGYIEPDSPAAKASNRIIAEQGPDQKLETRDSIRLIRDFACGVDSSSKELIKDKNLLPNTKCLKRINNTDDLLEATKTLSTDFHNPVVVTIERHGQIIDLYTELRSKSEVDASKKTDKPKGYLGISPAEYTIQRSTWSAPIVAAGFIKQVTVLTFKGLGSALAGLFSGNTAKASAQVSGPVGIFVLLKDGSLLGYQFTLMIIAIISLTLAIMNVLPIPALDGGRLFVTLIFKAARKPLKQKTEDLIHGTGFAVLMVLFVLITIVDVRRFF